MATKKAKTYLLEQITASSQALSLSDIQRFSAPPIPQRTLQRWLKVWVDDGLVRKTGIKRSARYHTALSAPQSPLFLKDVPPNKKLLVLKQLRDLWTHSSTALEGNTLSLGDTHFLLEEGLTVSGKSLKDHQEVVGHAKAIDCVYAMLDHRITEDEVFKLHRAVQTEQITDIYKPNGAWKLEPNGTYIVTKNNEQHYLEYALPQHVPALMSEVIDYINSLSLGFDLEIKNAHQYYAKLHAAIAHIHPFWDGNGRMARLLSNIPLLKHGLPPLVISQDNRREYIQLLADYELKLGQLSDKTGVWPNDSLLVEFEGFCEREYGVTRRVVDEI